MDDSKEGRKAKAHGSIYKQVGKRNSVLPSIKKQLKFLDDAIPF